MSAVEQFANPEYSNFASWIYAGKRVEIANQGRLLGLLKNDGRILVIHIDRSFGRNNAFIYSVSGDIEKQIMIPAEMEGAICFDDAYYDGVDLTLIAASREGRVACVINEDGNVVRCHESR